MPQISSDSPAGSEVPGYLSGALTGQVMDRLVIAAASPPSRATLAPGRQPRGSVLGKITATGLYALSDPMATDGRQNPDAVLVSDAGAPAMVRTDGTFNGNYLLWSQNWTLPALSAALNAAGITTLTRGMPPN